MVAVGVLVAGVRRAGKAAVGVSGESQWAVGGCSGCGTKSWLLPDANWRRGTC